MNKKAAIFVKIFTTLHFSEATFDVWSKRTAFHWNPPGLIWEWQVKTLTFDFSFLALPLSIGDAVVTVRQHVSGSDTSGHTVDRPRPGRRTAREQGRAWERSQFPN